MNCVHMVSRRKCSICAQGSPVRSESDANPNYNPDAAITFWQEELAKAQAELSHSHQRFEAVRKEIETVPAQSLAALVADNPMASIDGDCVWISKYRVLSAFDKHQPLQPDGINNG